MSTAARLLLVEDDTGIGRMLERGLGAEGYTVDWVRDIRRAIAATRAAAPDIVVLDRMLPDGDGATFCGALRRAGCAAPICMLTARDTLEDKLRGFDAGADDYLTKPFEFEELLARLAVLRRRATPIPPVVRLDDAARALVVGAHRVALTGREWPLMVYLMAHTDRPVSRAELIAQAWGLGGRVTENSVDVYVGYLRRKLADLDSGIRIETVRGIGFMLAK